MSWIYLVRIGCSLTSISVMCLWNALLSDKPTQSDNIVSYVNYKVSVTSNFQQWKIGKDVVRSGFWPVLTLHENTNQLLSSTPVL